MSQVGLSGSSSPDSPLLANSSRYPPKSCRRLPEPPSPPPRAAPFLEAVRLLPLEGWNRGATSASGGGGPIRSGSSLPGWRSDRPVALAHTVPCLTRRQARLPFIRRKDWLFVLVPQFRRYLPSIDTRARRRKFVSEKRMRLRVRLKICIKFRGQKTFVVLPRPFLAPHQSWPRGVGDAMPSSSI